MSKLSNDVLLTRQFLRRRLTVDKHSCPTLTGLDAEYKQLRDIVWRTAALSESNSVLLIGPRGAGKTLLLNTVICELQQDAQTVNNFVTVQLNGLLQKDDKVALKEITRQLNLENVASTKIFGSFAENLQFLLEAFKTGGVESKSLLFVLEEFDLFAGHHNQTLLYNLFDVAQSAAAPLCVIGLTARLDVLELLEKRVKSRFSHRQLLICPSLTFADYVTVFNNYLMLPRDHNISASFVQSWNDSVKLLSQEPAVLDVLRQQYNIDTNITALKTFLLVPVCKLCAECPVLEASQFINSFKLLHATDCRAAMINGLSVLELCLIIAMKHLTERYDAEPFNFEMVFSEYEKFCRSHSSIQLFDRVVVMKSYEQLCQLELVRCVSETGSKSTAEYQLITLHVDSSQIMDSLQKLPSCPTDIRQWAASTVH